MSMSKEDELHYNNYFDLFRSDGWQQLTEELKTNAEMLNQVVHIQDAEDLWNKQGQMLILQNLLNLENSVTLVYEDLTSVESI